MVLAPRARFAPIDWLKAAAIVAVTVTHAIPDAFNPIASRWDQIAGALTAFHVPGFLFAAGFLACRHGPVAWRGVGRRLTRVLGPYLVASVIVLLLGYGKAPTLRRFVFHLVTGSVLGIYYFVPVMACCLLTLPVTSRLGTGRLVALIGTLVGYAHVAWRDPSWRLTDAFFWQIRDLLLQFHLGHFTLGVLAARHLSAWTAPGPRTPSALLLAGGIVVVGYAWLAYAGSVLVWEPLAHTAYLLGWIGIFVALARGPAPAAVRFLSDATLTIYLYHYLVYPFVVPALRSAVGAPAQLALTSALGVAFGALVALTAHRVLGSRSRASFGW